MSCACFCAAAATCIGTHALAQAYPSRNVTIVVPPGAAPGAAGELANALDRLLRDVVLPRMPPSG